MREKIHASNCYGFFGPHGNFETHASKGKKSMRPKQLDAWIFFLIWFTFVEVLNFLLGRLSFLAKNVIKSTLPLGRNQHPARHWIILFDFYVDLRLQVIWAYCKYFWNFIPQRIRNFQFLLPYPHTWHAYYLEKVYKTLTISKMSNYLEMGMKWFYHSSSLV